MPSVLYKSELVFVSGWMRDEFVKSTRLLLKDIEGHYDITYNGVGAAFQENSYSGQGEKQYDFVTIRSLFDESKYCIDIVNELARRNPQARFLLVGKGAFFEHNEKAANLVWENRTMDHQQIIRILQSSRCALMPTRTDAQGLMACEMATFGIPLITSDIPVCHEVFEGFENVAMINNSELDIDLLALCERLEKGVPYSKNSRYFGENTCAHEVDCIRSIGAAEKKAD